MDELLARYQDELGRIRRLCREFADDYPRLAARLHMSGEVCEDPHVERLIQSSALIAARVSKRLDDDYPQFTEALLELLLPHYLRPFPACAIVRVDCAREKWGDKAVALSIPRGTVLESAAVKGVQCKFTTAYDVDIAPIFVAKAQFDAEIKSPGNVRLPRDSTASIRIVLETQSSTTSLASLGMNRLRAFIDGEPSFCAALRDALFMKAVAAFAEAEDGTWRDLGGVPISPVGFAEDEALIPFGARLAIGGPLFQGNQINVGQWSKA